MRKEGRRLQNVADLIYLCGYGYVFLRKTLMKDERGSDSYIILIESIMQVLFYYVLVL